MAESIAGEAGHLFPPRIVVEAASGNLLGSHSLACWLTGLLLGITFVYIRIADIATRPLWHDEAGQVWVSAAPTIHQMHERALAWDRHPPGFSWLLRPFALAGAEESMLRSISLAAGILTLLGGWIMTKAWLPAAEAGAAVLLLASSAPLALYAHEARPYAAALLTLILFLWMLGLHWNKASWRTTLGLGLTSMVATVFLYASIVVVGTALVVTLVCHLADRAKPSHRAAGLWLSLVALAVVGAWLGVAYLRHYEGIAATSQMYLGDLPQDGSLTENGFFLVRSTVDLMGYLVIGHAYGPRWATAGVVVGIAMVLLAIVGSVTLWRRGGASRVLSVTLVATVIAFMTLSLLHLHPYGAGRHCLALGPSVFMAVATGLGTLHHRMPRLAVGSIAILAILGATSSLRCGTPNYMIEDLPRVLRGLETRSQPGDRLVVMGQAALAFEYYRKRCHVEKMPFEVLERHAISSGEKLAQLAPSDARRCWLVFSHCTAGDVSAVEEAFTLTCDRVDKVTSDGSLASCWSIRNR